MYLILGLSLSNFQIIAEEVSSMTGTFQRMSHNLTPSPLPCYMCLSNKYKIKAKLSIKKISTRLTTIRISFTIFNRTHIHKKK